MEDELNEGQNNQSPEKFKNLIKIDIFQHIKLNMKNIDKNCSCEGSFKESYYCIPCKISCCPKCTLSDHRNHIIVPREKYSLKDNKIDEAFKSIETAISQNELTNKKSDKRKELIKCFEDTTKAIISCIEEWKKKKIKEINSIFDDFDYNFQNIEKYKTEIRKELKNFEQKNQKFFGEKENNNDPFNIIFLINYDLLSIPHLWSEDMTKKLDNITKSILGYKSQEENKNKLLIKKIKDILSKNDEEDPLTNEKIDQKLLPIVKLKVDIKNFNYDQLSDVDRRIKKINKGIENFKHFVLNSVQKNGTYKDIVRENNVYEHRKIKGAENLFSQRKIDALSKFDDGYIIPSHPIKNKTDITLDNQVLFRYFVHSMTDLYDQYFRTPTIELKSSHADLKLKTTTDSNGDEDIQNSGKVIEGTNQIVIYDKKMNKMIKRKLKLVKNPHGYTKFPLGCRWVMVGDRLYITGGKDEYKEYANCIIYDKKTQQIKRIMDMKYPRCYHTLVFNEIFETLMVIGGEKNNTVEIFDPLTNRWQLLPELNIPRAIPLFYFDEGRGNLYVLFGMEGNFSKPLYTDSIEILDLTEIKQGWMKINYKNMSRMNLKCFLNFYPLNDFLLLIYGGLENRESKRNACVYNLVKAEMTKIDKNILEELRQEAKSNKFLNTIVMSVSKSSFTDYTEEKK